MQSSELVRLMDKYLADDITPDELRQLRRLAGNDGSDAELDAYIEKVLLENRFPLTQEADGPALLEDIRRETGMRPRKAHIFRRWQWAAAALLLLGAVTYLLTKQPEQPVVQQQADITPGRNGAILTLADGTAMVLDSLENGIIAQQSGISLTLQNGQLAYHSVGKNSGTDAWNTVTTPKGRQFTVVLPDGSKIWLNAASSVRYPVNFGTAARKVEVTGEAYFEVAANPGKPFRVTAGATHVEVLGTDFNINAYTDEPSLKATLLRGSIRVVSGASSQVLQPGQQAVITDHITIEKNADVGQATAWKDGLFNFSGATLEEVLRQIARWYDLEIKYIHQPSKRAFQGRFGRDLQLSQVLEVLSLYNIKYTLDGRKLTIR